MKSPWTDREDDLLREAIAARMSMTRTLARIIGRNERAVRHRAKRLGLEIAQ